MFHIDQLQIRIQQGHGAVVAHPPGLIGQAFVKSGGHAGFFEGCTGQGGLGPTGSGAQTTLKSAPAVDPLARLRTSDGLAGCLTALSDAGQPAVPLALDYARYQGKPALVVVLPSSKEDKADVFVVGSGCSTADAKLLFFARLPKS